MQHSVINWTAKRSGAAITITGVLASTAEPVKLGGIREIRVRDGLLEAVEAGEERSEEKIHQLYV